MMPLLLICCEGKTEQQYFQILQRMFRLPGARVFIIGERGQLKALINRTVQEREKLCAEHGFSAEEIECWAVCDDDGMAGKYAELLAYAEANNIQLAFSRPQFEAFVLQHFEQSGEYRQAALYERLNFHKEDYERGPYNKGDLSWLKTAIDKKPRLVDIAIVNADQRQRQSEKLFLTVQDLVKRMKELGK